MQKNVSKKMHGLSSVCRNFLKRGLKFTILWKYTIYCCFEHLCGKFLYFF